LNDVCKNLPLTLPRAFVKSTAFKKVVLWRLGQRSASHQNSTTNVRAVEVVVHAVEVVGIKVYMIAVAIDAVAIITNMLGNKIAVIYGVLDVKMNIIADVLDGKTATASKLNTGLFAKRTPGIRHLPLVQSMGDIKDGITSIGDSAKLAVDDGAGGVVGVISIIAGAHAPVTS
jgi:hypothetical protein